MIEKNHTNAQTSSTSTSLIPSPSNIPQSGIAISDWVTFLSSEKGLSFNTVLNFGVILLAFVGITFSTRAVGWTLVVLESVVAIGFAIYAWYKVFIPAGRKGRIATDVLEKIMSGKLKSSDDIQKYWLDKSQGK